MAIVNIGTGELHKLKDTGVVDSGGAVEGQVAVILTGAPNLFDTAGVAGAKVEGFALHDAAEGEVFTLVKSGFMVVLAGAAVSALDLLTVDANGKAVTAGGGDHVLGKAYTDAAALDDELLIELFQSGYAI